MNSLTSTDTLSVVAFPQQTVDTTDWECETSFGGAAVKMSVIVLTWKRRVKTDEKRVKVMKSNDSKHQRALIVVEEVIRQNLRLRRGLGARGLSTGFAASHFESGLWG